MPVLSVHATLVSSTDQTSDSESKLDIFEILRRTSSKKKHEVRRFRLPDAEMRRTSETLTLRSLPYSILCCQLMEVGIFYKHTDSPLRVHVDVITHSVCQQRTNEYYPLCSAAWLDLLRRPPVLSFPKLSVSIADRAEPRLQNQWYAVMGKGTTSGAAACV